VGVPADEPAALARAPAALVTPAALLEELLALAAEVGIEVRSLGGQGDLPAHSGSCRLRGIPCLWLDPGEPVEDRIEVTVQALRTFASEQLEDRFIPPALRARLERSGNAQPGPEG